MKISLAYTATPSGTEDCVKPGSKVVDSSLVGTQPKEQGKISSEKGEATGKTDGVDGVDGLAQKHRYREKSWEIGTDLEMFKASKGVV